MFNAITQSMYLYHKKCNERLESNMDTIKTIRQLWREERFEKLREGLVDVPSPSMDIICPIERVWVVRPAVKKACKTSNSKEIRNQNSCERGIGHDTTYTQDQWTNISQMETIVNEGRHRREMRAYVYFVEETSSSRLRSLGISWYYKTYVRI